MQVSVSLQPHVLRRRFSITRRAFVGRSFSGKMIPIFSHIDRKAQISTFRSTSSKLAQKKSQTYTSEKTQSRRKPLRFVVFLLLMSMSLTIFSFLAVPFLYYQFFGQETVPIQTSEVGTPLGGDFISATPARPTIPEPTVDETLPDGQWLVIPRIGVRTEILESQDPAVSLAKGVWRVPDFGTPGSQNQPVIVAAHRYGYNWWWKGDYWKYHSFYLLPTLEPGDVVEVIANKKKYIYEIYAGEEGSEITDYDADLILYTCKFLTSPLRHFRYARLIDPSKYLKQSPSQTGSGV